MKYLLTLEIEADEIGDIVIGVSRVAQNIQHGHLEAEATMGLHEPVIAYRYKIDYVS